MGAGKSCIGRLLAGALGLPFVDADKEIEAAAGCSIEDIFVAHGEAAFREGERRVIARLLTQPRMVLATGGGAFMEPETRPLIRERATTVRSAVRRVGEECVSVGWSRGSPEHSKNIDSRSQKQKTYNNTKH